MFYALVDHCGNSTFSMVSNMFSNLNPDVPHDNTALAPSSAARLLSEYLNVIKGRLGLC
jgi:hypothetical protein